MVTKTRSHSHSYDNRVWYRDDKTPEKSVGGSVEVHSSSVTADYPQWDYRKRIQRHENCTTALSGWQSGYRDRPLTGDVRSILGKLDLSPAVNGYSHHEYRFWQLSQGKVTNLITQRLRGHIWRSNLSSSSSNASLQATVQNQALMGFNRSIRKLQTEWNALVTAGELGEALRGMLHPMKSLRTATDDFYRLLTKRALKNRRAKPEAIHRVAADTWLEFAYGVRPTVADVQDAARACARVRILQPMSRMARWSAYGSKTVAVNDNVTTSGGYLRVRRRKQIRNEYVGCKFYGIVGNEPLDQGAENFLKVFGITWHEVVPTVWELIPYSFLVDYFTNCGEIISAFSHGRAGLKWASRGTTFLSESFWSDVELEVLNPSNVLAEAVISSPGGRCYKVRRNVSRGTYTGTMIPSFEWTVPGMSTKWLNMAALAASHRRADYALRGR